MAKVSHTGEEVLALKKYIQKCHGDMERLQEVIGNNKQKDNFLLQHRWGRRVG